MIHQSDRPERGQALVLIVLGFVVLLGFTALAVDGGMLYADRRHAQNGSDASSLAGGGAAAKYLETNHIYYPNWDCSGSVAPAMTAAENAAIARAADNDFTMALSGENRVETNCSNRVFNRYMDITTTITADTSTSFVHFVYRGPMRNTVEAVTRVKPRTPFAFGHAVVGLNDDNCQGQQNGVLFHGSIEVNIHGGGIFSNGCLGSSGGSPEINVFDGGIAYGGEEDSNHPVFNVTPQDVNTTMPPEAYALPDMTASCAAATSRTCTGPGGKCSGTLDPGKYASMILNGTTHLRPGLYCITGSLDAGNNDLDNVPYDGKDGVTLYIQNGSFETGGNGHVDLSSPQASPDPAPALAGILIYADGASGCEVKLRGNAGSQYTGVVFAPKCNVTASGNPDVTPTFHTQIIGWNVEIGGNVDFDINYRGADEYAKPTDLELFK